MEEEKTTYANNLICFVCHQAGDLFVLSACKHVLCNPCFHQIIDNTPHVLDGKFFQCGVCKNWNPLSVTHQEILNMIKHPQKQNKNAPQSQLILMKADSNEGPNFNVVSKQNKTWKLLGPMKHVFKRVANLLKSPDSPKEFIVVRRQSFVELIIKFNKKLTLKSVNSLFQRCTAEPLSNVYSFDTMKLALGSAGEQYVAVKSADDLETLEETYNDWMMDEVSQESNQYDDDD